MKAINSVLLTANLSILKVIGLTLVLHSSVYGMQQDQMAPTALTDGTLANEANEIELDTAAQDELIHATMIANSSRFLELSKEIACPSCQGSSIADSPSPIAIGMRKSLKKMIDSGLSDAEIHAQFAQKYGWQVVFDPPIKGSTVLLWILPFIVLGIGLGIIGLGIYKNLQRTSNSDA